jgi:hypothetical protein
MALDDIKRPVEDIRRDIVDCLSAKSDEVKLKAVKGLSKVFSTVLAWFVGIMLGLSAMLFLSIALATWLGELLGNPIFGWLITGGVYFILMLIGVKIAKKGVQDKLVRFFISIFYGDK